jgi:hypothetical protein
MQISLAVVLGDESSEGDRKWDLQCDGVAMLLSGFRGIRFVKKIGVGATAARLLRACRHAHKATTVL